MTEEEETVDTREFSKIVNIQTTILKYLDEDKSQKSNFSCQKLLDDLNSQKNCIDTKEALHLLRSIINNHHRSPDFFNKIEEILNSLKENIKQTFTNSELFDFFSQNKRILLFLIKNKIITIDKPILQKIAQPSNINYFFPEIEEFYAGHSMNFEGENQTNYEIYEEKRKLGENDDVISKMIRNDSVEEFIAYVNRINYKLNSKMGESHFETNEYLINNRPTLIEYAAFYGSIQIFQYLKMNNVELNPSLWMYTIHSNNPELIHILEENNVIPKDKTFKECIIEAIKCHHNDIANYLICNKSQSQNQNYIKEYLTYDNYEGTQSGLLNSSQMDLQYIYDCIKSSPKIVDLLIKESYFDANFKIVLKL